MNEEKYISSFQKVLIISSILLIAALAWAWIESGPAQEWMRYQRDYKKQWTSLTDSLSQITMSIPETGVRQTNPEGLNRIDRCITCHAGIENPFMNGVGMPFKPHSGEFLTHHSTEEYGCTICHGGQGRALNKKEAHALSEDVHWGQPILTQPYIQSACGQCHLTIFSEQQAFEGTEVFQSGHEIFTREGCLGCHKARGVGGIIGPDLTEQGEKTRSEYNFENIETEQSVSNWLKEHFRDPEMVSPGSQMLSFNLPESDLEALTTFVLGLTKPEIDFTYFSIETLNEFKGNRAELMPDHAFSMVCSGCHGKTGEGKDYSKYETGVPAIFGEDFTRVASDEYLAFTLRKGRSERQMAAWMPEISGFTANEIVMLVAFIKGRHNHSYVPFNQSTLRRADRKAGALLYDNLCSTCHGPEGSGGVALALNRTDLLRNASDAYLYETLLTGRGNATMPSWNHLSSVDIYAVVAYLRSFQDYSPISASVQFAGENIEEGRMKYLFMCSRCHGDAGQGQTGPAIINKGFLSVASDAFLYNTISSGREHTAMFGWSTDVYNQERLTKDDIGNIIFFLREAASRKPEYIYAGANPGNKSAGEKLFRTHCRECHGDKGEGSKAPALNNQEFLSAASNGHIMASISLGRAGTEMPSWGKEEKGHPALSAAARKDIVAYVRSWERIRIHF
ncbi:c-type cytochrome [Bacteroidota bacterium]